jgi:hypothetical protein
LLVVTDIYIWKLLPLDLRVGSDECELLIRQVAQVIAHAPAGEDGGGGSKRDYLAAPARADNRLDRGEIGGTVRSSPGSRRSESESVDDPEPICFDSTTEDYYRLVRDVNRGGT